MKRRMVLAVLIPLILVALPLLGTGKTEKPAAAPAPAASTVTLNMMGWKWAPGDEMERVMAQFTKDTGIKINLELMDYANYYQVLTTRLNGSEIDLAFAHAAPFYYPYADANLYYTNEELGVDTSFLAGSALAQVTRNGKTWLIPGGMNAMVLFVNNKIMKDNGWAYPKNWDEWMALCQKMVDKGIKPIDCSFQFNNTRYLWYPLEAAKITHKDPKFWANAVANKTNPFTDPRWREIFTQIITMWNKNYLANDLSVVSNDVIMNTEFGEGRVAMMLSGTWSIGIMRDYQKKGLDYKAVMVPCNDANYPENVLPVAAAPGFGVNRKTAKLAQAKVFAKWWANKVKIGDIGKEWGWPPPAASAPFSLFTEAGQDQLFGYYKGPGEPFTEVQLPSIEIADTIDKDLQSVFTKQMTLDAAILDIQAKWKQVTTK
jgi:ABC-type glycerol-3-phosphate transport system substrate-binding protein